MNAFLRFLRRLWFSVATSASIKPRWHCCPRCGVYQRDGVATSMQPPADARIESEPRICVPCRYDIGGGLW